MWCLLKVLSAIAIFQVSLSLSMQDPLLIFDTGIGGKEVTDTVLKELNDAFGTVVEVNDIK